MGALVRWANEISFEDAHTLYARSLLCVLPGTWSFAGYAATLALARLLEDEDERRPSRQDIRGVREVAAPDGERRGVVSGVAAWRALDREQRAIGPEIEHRERGMQAAPCVHVMLQIRPLQRAWAQRINRDGDLALLWLAAVAAAWGGALDVPLAAELGILATLLWLGASRVLHQYDDSDTGRSVLGDLALTAIMLGAVALPILAAGSTSLLPGTHAIRFATVLVPSALALRFATVGWGLWDSRYIDTILIAGIGPLGRLTGEEIESSRTRHRVLGYLRFDDQTSNERLHAPVLDTVNDLESTLKRQVVDEVYFASSSLEHVAEVQEGNPHV